MKSYIKYIFTSVILVIASSCGSETTEVKEDEHHVEPSTVEFTKEQFITSDIEYGNIEMKSLGGTIRSSGILDVPPQNLVSISSIFGGTIKSTELLEGMKIRKGQVVAMIQNPDFINMQQDYLDFKSQMDYLKLEYERQKELTDVNAKRAVQKAKSEYESMKARVNGIHSRLELMNISISKLENGTIQNAAPLYSPINGYVTKVNTNIGANVTPTDVLFEIADTEHLHAELTVYERDLPSIKIGQKVRFTLSNETTDRWATVYLIGREISKDRTVKIHCHLEKEDKELLPGMYLKALIERGQTNVTAVRDESIVEFEGDHYIFIEGRSDHKDEFLFKSIQVQKGASEFGYTAISIPSGLDWKTMKIVTNGAYDILSKMKNSEEEGGHAH